jgi:hypothetical protein
MVPQGPPACQAAAQIGRRLGQYPRCDRRREHSVVETSDYRSAAETRRNPLLQVKAGYPFGLPGTPKLW